MVEQAQTPSSASSNKEIEITSNTRSSGSLERSRDHDIDKEEKGEELDIEAEEDEIDENDPHGDGYGGKENVMGTAATRSSTKSSWKDPGPPPDGGWSGWTQGESRNFLPSLLLSKF
jgi:hypothetical protein